ncbi:MAG: ABC transporter ATP-binding protein [Spirochaetia bacterium]|nr:ABC transporter ATP-binding protein [Spirochaetia bacterium]
MKITGESLLEFKGYSMGFKDEGVIYNLLDNVSFSVRRGAVLGVVGESGCGKSMTSLSVMRLLPPEAVVQAGEIMFDGENLLDKREAEMEKLRGREIGMVFQEPMTSLNPVFTVGRQIGESLAIHFPTMSKDEIRNEVYQLLEHVGISNASKRFDQYPHQLSGGMRQRVMIAMAVACKPKLLIADEPTTALDVTIQAQVLELMKQLVNESGSSMMLITHNLGVVAESCDEAVVMYAGQIVEKGSVDHIFNRHSHPYTAGLMASIPSRSHGEGDLYSIPGTVPSIDKFVKGCRFAARCAHKRPSCEAEAPPLAEVAPGHFVACWNFGEK